MRRELAGKRRKQRIAPQRIVIVEVFVAQRQAEHAQSHKRRNAMFDQLRIAMVDKATRKTLGQSQRFVDLPQ